MAKKKSSSSYASQHQTERSAREAQEFAHIIAFGPVIFQVTRLMLHWGIFDILRDHPEGIPLEAIAAATGKSEYAVKVLLESSLTLGTVASGENGYTLTKTGWFFLTDPMLKVNIDFNHDINYLGMFRLDQALEEGRPAGLETLGPWPTIYEGLSSLTPRQKESWFGFDHFYSDSAFDLALPKVFSSRPARILDIGGNTGKWALKCVGYDPDVRVTIADLPGQIAMMKDNIAGKNGADRIDGYPVDILAAIRGQGSLPTGYDVVWMSQFLDCFSAPQVESILSLARKALSDNGRIYIMETLWDRQKYSAAAFDLAQTSVYFTAMANGNSKMFNTPDLWSHIRNAGLEVSAVTDGMGYAHSLIECRIP